MNLSATFLEAHGILYGMLIAGSVLVTIPVLILFILVQKHLIRGFGVGTVE
jgi:ABC-type glycerol-3-phosphate transport system permease component